MENIVVYRNRIEAKILSIAIGVIWGALYAFVLISDIGVQNPHFWHNQKRILFIGLVFCIPVMIYRRFRIEFHFAERSIIHVGYFSRKNIILLMRSLFPPKRAKVSFRTLSMSSQKTEKSCSNSQNSTSKSKHMRAQIA